MTQVATDLSTSFNSERWNRELADDLYALALKIVETEGEIEIRKFMGGEFDTDQIDHFLRKGAEIAARNINDSTAAIISEHSTSKSISDVLKAFLQLLLGGARADSRAHTLALSRATALQSVASLEAAKQRGGVYTKKWIGSGYPNSRHKHIAGEERLLFEPFSNGLQHPGDPAGPPDQTVNCKCHLEVSGGPTPAMLVAGKSENWRGEPRDEHGRWITGQFSHPKVQWWENELADAEAAGDSERIAKANARLDKLHKQNAASEQAVTTVSNEHQQHLYRMVETSPSIAEKVRKLMVIVDAAESEGVDWRASFEKALAAYEFEGRGAHGNTPERNEALEWVAAHEHVLQNLKPEKRQQESKQPQHPKAPTSNKTRFTVSPLDDGTFGVFDNGQLHSKPDSGTWGAAKKIADKLNDAQRTVRMKWPPQLAKEPKGDQGFQSGPDWVVERKWDGMRAIFENREDGIYIFSRTGQDLRPQFPELLELHDKLPPDTILDGEIVALDANGVDDLERLQLRAGDKKARRQKDIPVTVKFFDVLQDGGHDTRDETVPERKARLHTIVGANSELGPDHLVETLPVGSKISDIPKFWEGTVSKKADSKYESGKRRATWLKYKFGQSATLRVTGLTPGKGSRSSSFGAVTVADANGVPRGSVGSGFSEEDIKTLLEAQKTGNWPLIEVAYRMTSKNGQLVNTAYKGIRHDKTEADDMEADGSAQEHAPSADAADWRDRWPGIADSWLAVADATFDGVTVPLDGTGYRWDAKQGKYVEKPGVLSYEGNEKAAAIESYRTDSYKKINKLLRDGKDTSRKPAVQALDEEMRPVKRDIMVHRVVQEKFGYHEAEVGSIFEDKAFTYTSSDEALVDRIVTETYLVKGTPTFLNIRVPKGSKALNMASVESNTVFWDTVHNPGAEIVLPRNTKLKIVAKRQRPDGIWEIDMEVVP